MNKLDAILPNTAQLPNIIDPQLIPIEIYKEEIGGFLISNRADYTIFRGISYILQAEGSMNEILQKSLVPTSLTVPTFAIIGGGIGAFLGGLVTWYWPGVSWVGPVVGGSVGVGAGVAIAGATSTAIVTLRVQHSEHYNSWKQNLVDTKVYELFIDYLLKDETLCDCICPLTLDLMVTPMKAPDGVIYDQGAIVKWINQKPEGTPSSIYREIDFSEGELVFDKDTFLKIAKRVNFLLKNTIDTFEKECIITKALTGFMNARKNTYSEIINKMNEVSKELRTNEKIDLKRYEELQEEIRQLEEEIF